MKSSSILDNNNSRRKKLLLSIAILVLAIFFVIIGCGPADVYLLVGVLCVVVLVLSLLATILKNKVFFVLSLVGVSVTEVFFILCLCNYMRDLLGLFILQWIVMTAFMVTNIVISGYSSIQSQKPNAAAYCMFCPNCGKRFTEGKRFCDVCGSGLKQIVN